ncbi:hypothetical protein BpHYR1_001205 [Brachionus plicatilis]|uniref:Uncharacterized protein n=1 Tax=Brachionus plicatilis TaxID=10195 RepID=A0A3M7PAF7_BRAPC|nr:hypothetical protein BpHYR1_001205 [Brachionus plicatilis]
MLFVLMMHGLMTLSHSRAYIKDLLKLVPKNSNFKESWKKAGDSFKNDKNKKNKIPTKKFQNSQKK